MHKWYYIFSTVVVVAMATVCVMLVTHRMVEAPVVSVATHGAIDTTDLIHVTYPKPGDVVSPPVILTGEARGNWYFEASFPIVIVDWDGRVIAQGHAEAQSDWMTTEYVPFKTTLDFIVPPSNENNKSYISRGTVIFKNDNPSGDSAKAAALEVPVVFK